MKKNKFNGKFIVVEGPNGSGKSTFIKKLEKELMEKGKEVFLTKEISNSEVGKFAYKAMGQMHGLSYACLMASDRYEHLKKEIIPALKQGKTVICDRYALSSLVYQCMDGCTPEFILKINSEIIIPDLTIVLTASEERAKETGIELDRFETGNQSGIELHFLEEGIRKLEKKKWKFSIFSNETEEDFESNPRIASFLIREL